MLRCDRPRLDVSEQDCSELPDFCAQLLCSTGAMKVEFAERGIAACLGERDQPIETLDPVDLVR